MPCESRRPRDHSTTRKGTERTMNHETLDRLAGQMVVKLELPASRARLRAEVFSVDSLMANQRAIVGVHPHASAGFAG